MGLRDYLRVIRSRVRLILVVALGVAVVAAAVSALQAPKYHAEAKVLVMEQDTGAALFGSLLPEVSSQPERGLQTQIQLMQMTPLAEKAIRAKKLATTPAELLSRVTVSSTGQTNLVTIEVTDSDPVRAALSADALADAYIAWSRDLARTSIHRAAVEVTTRLEETQRQIQAMGAGAALGDSAQQTRLATIRAQYGLLSERLNQLRISEDLETGSGSVVMRATVDGVPISPRPTRDGVLGLFIGLALAFGVAFLAEYLDTTIKDAGEAEGIYGAPVLAQVPGKGVGTQGQGRIVLTADPGGPAAEAYRGLRNGLDFLDFEHDITTLLVTSAEPAEGKSTVAANLAVALSQAGKRVALVVCDFRKPNTTQFFDVQDAVGLSDVLTGAKPIGDTLQNPPGTENLWVLTSGKMPPNPSELLGSDTMQRLVKSLRESFDWVIVDTPPLLAVADAAAVAKWADGLLIVTRGGVSKRDAAKRSREMIDQVGARVLGIVVWGVKAAPGAAGYYGSSAYRDAG